MVAILSASGADRTRAEGWDDYQIIMWQPHDAAQDAALKRLGVTAGTLHLPDKDDPSRLDGAMGPLLQNGLRWYVENIATDFYSAYHRWSPDHPVNWRFAVVKKLYQSDPSNREALLRDPSLSDPVWLRKIGQRLTATVTAQRRYKPLYYNLGDETGIGDLSVFWDFDFSDESLAGMRQWLQQRYGTLAALNREWDTQFASWDAVMPFTTRLAMRRAGDNFAPWADFRAWMDVAFARAVRFGTDAVHAGDPQALAAIEGAQVSGWGGYDYSRLAPTVDAVEVYDDGENLVALRSFNPKLVLLTTSGGGGPVGIHALWQELLRGTRGIILWDPKGEVVGRDAKAGERGREIAPTLQEIGGGLGALLIGSKPQVAPVAILYSPASLRTQWMLDWRPQGDAWSDRDAESDYEDPSAVRSAMNDELGALTHLGLEPQFFSDEMIAGGALERGGVRVLFLPQSIALSPAAAAAIRRFVAAGGTAVAEAVPGQFDDHSRRLAKPLLSDVFVGAAPAAAQPVSFGAGKSISVGKTPGLDRLAKILAAAGVATPAILQAENGARVADVEAHAWLNDGTTILALQRDWPEGSQGGQTAAEAVELTLPRDAYVYDLRSGTALGRKHALNLALDPVAPTILAIASEAWPSGCDSQAAAADHFQQSARATYERASSRSCVAPSNSPSRPER